nr:alpha/beta hydrolase-fold protein [Chitinophagaceae bacterium]
MRGFLLLSLLLYSFFCSAQESIRQENAPTVRKRLYSGNVGDSFTVYLKLPPEYRTETKRRFTTIYLLDADIYFDIVVAMAEQYKQIGVMPPVIVAGIGYGSFEKMEKLRTRDFLYPKAPSREKMPNSGGGLAFHQFLERELIPYLDSTYRTKPENRILMGHSFGGYFTLFALLQNLKEQRNVYRSYIAASPSLQYGNQYLLQQLQQSTSDFSLPRLVYTSLGDLEDKEDGKQEQPISAMFRAFL